MEVLINTQAVCCLGEGGGGALDGPRLDAIGRRRSSYPRYDSRWVRLAPRSELRYDLNFVRSWPALQDEISLEALRFVCVGVALLVGVCCKFHIHFLWFRLTVHGLASLSPRFRFPTLAFASLDCPRTRVGYIPWLVLHTGDRTSFVSMGQRGYSLVGWFICCASPPGSRLSCRCGKKSHSPSRQYATKSRYPAGLV